MLRTLPFVLLILLSCQSHEPAALPALKLDLRVEPLNEEASLLMFGKKPAFEVLFGGMDWAEGPLVLPDGRVICSDVPQNIIYAWSGQDREVYLTNSGDSPEDYSREQGSNGLALDQQGRLLLCQHGARRVARMEAPTNQPQGQFTSLADNYEGKRFNSPNDLVVAADGSILFTDPTYGLPGGKESSIRELDYCGVYRIRTDGSVQLLTKAYEQPNGIGLSPDGKTLYVADSDGSQYVIDAIPILNDQYQLGKAERIVDALDLKKTEIGSPDGLSVAKNGRIFATAPGGVWVMEPNGEVIAKVRTGTSVSNVELSPREDYLYLTADYYLIRIKIN